MVDHACEGPRVIATIYVHVPQGHGQELVWKARPLLRISHSVPGAQAVVLAFDANHAALLAAVDGRALLPRTTIEMLFQAIAVLSKGWAVKKS